MVNITVPNYPSTNRTPGIFFSVNNSNANTASPLLGTLLVGQILSTGTATPNVPVLATSAAQVATLCGTGSMLARMYNAYVQDDGFGSITLLPVSDASGGTAAIYTATVTGPATSTGTLALYVAGTLCAVAVNSGDAATTIATNMAAAINAQTGLHCSAATASAVVTITARHKGVAAGDIDLRLNYQGALAGEVIPAGVTVTFANSTPGATDPTLTTALGNLTQAYAFICSPYTGSAQFASFQSLLSDVAGWWSWLWNVGGGAFAASKGTAGTLQTYGVTNNLQHFSVLGLNDTPTTGFEMAADYCAACANSLRADPALPLTAIQLSAILAPPQQSRFTRTVRNTLLYAGISTAKVNSANQVILERAITTYQQNASGAPDDSYLNVETLYTLQAVIAMWKDSLSTKYARVKLVDNGTPIRPGTSTVNPNSIRVEFIAQYQAAADAGLVQDVATFAKNVAVDKVSPTQVNVYAPVMVADQLFDIAINMAFTK